jgi:hypothetical protein
MKSICNFAYANRKQGGRRFPNVRRLLKYIQFRDDRDDHIPNAGGPDRWVDGGLGDRYQAILTRLDELNPGNRHAYCHSIVISPDPEALAEVEGDPQARFVRVVQDTLAEWDDWRQEYDEKPQIGPIEYSFVVHRPERNYGEQMHAHVIVAAATQDAMTGEYTALYNNAREIDAFKEIAYRQLDRAFGLDREQERDRPEPEPEIEVPEREIEFFSFFETQSTRGNEHDPQPSIEIE